METNSTRPIGIFDSGIGGLTVFAAIKKYLPDESLIYLGDTARLPYGTKSADTVIRYSRECATFLVKRGIKALVIACNTASAYALQELQHAFDIPVIGVIEPGAEAAILATKNHMVGVIGTFGTISSNAYGSTIKKKDPNIVIVSRACPLFVPLVEEGWIDDPITEMITHRYLDDMKNEGIDTCILGCTHYPLLKPIIQKVTGPSVTLVDSADTTATTLKNIITKIPNSAVAKQPDRIYVTDLPAKFESIAARFLLEDTPTVTRVDL